MPGLGRYPCATCDYVASNRRMLSRHVAVAHTDKVYKCPLCPFITRYPANWYRHKRGLHGMTKRTTCEVCGFFANSAQELAVHVESEHPGHHSPASSSQNSSDRLVIDEEQSIDQDQQDRTDGGENGLALVDEVSVADGHAQNDAEGSESIHFSLPMNGLFDSDTGVSNSNTPPVEQNPGTNKMASVHPNYTNLSPLKVRRSYCCDLCGLLTGDPREFLYHQRDVHKIRMNIHECTLCIYASKHIQKLQRHYGLVHRQKLPECFKTQTVSKNPKPKPVDNKEKSILPKVQVKAAPMVPVQESFPVHEPLPPPSRELPPQVSTYSKPKRQNILKCSACSYQTRNKFLLMHHEKMVHLKRKFFRCMTCGYVTNERARYTKHIKYHNLPKMKCEFCHFKSAYKWNMERHMKNHMAGGNGEFSCILCNFVTHSKQSLKMHVANHHHGAGDDSNDFPDADMDPNMLDEDEEEASYLPDENDEFEWDNNSEEESYVFSESEFTEIPVETEYKGRPLPPWKQKPKITPATDSKNRKLLKCSECDYTTIWSFEMRKHEENHKTASKKHSCPLCGMRFEHIAWLTKHLYRVHKENSEAKEIAAAYELMKPVRRRSKVPVNPPSSFSMSSEKSVHMPPPSSVTKPKQSVLSSLLRGTAAATRYLPILPKPAPPKATASYSKLPGDKPHSFTSADYNSIGSNKSDEPGKNMSMKKVSHACKFCGYKTKWISEMEKHMRVHSDEKPFRCSKCSYHSKWKGDLTRHMIKHHGMNIPNSKMFSIPSTNVEEKPSSVVDTKWEEEMVDEEPRSLRKSSKEQDIPLDLTTSKGSDSHPSDLSASEFDESEFKVEEIDVTEDNYMENDFSSSRNSFETSNAGVHLNEDFDEVQDDKSGSPRSESSSSARKYHCPFCSFTTSTPSRFHVHIVQHYNKKPFMCSQCGYRSNWEWDITKHIRLRKDKEHEGACVLLTDETGKRNYEKYEKYLKAAETKPKPLSSSTPQDSNTQLSTPSQNFSKDQQMSLDMSCAKEEDSAVAKSSGSDIAPVNIVVTPDLPFASDSVEESEYSALNTDFQNTEMDNVVNGDNNFKFYLCKHCNYKHSSRKVVIGHLSVHAGIKPFRCRVCGLSSNWRHVIVRHVKESHNGYMNDVEDRILYTQEGFVIRITSVKNSNKPSSMSSTNRVAQFQCKFCPYKCDKEVYIKFHMKQHKPRDGAIYQCLHCPYFVKFKKTLVRHMKLHEAPAAQDDSASKQEEFNAGNQNSWTEDDFVMQADSSNMEQYKTDNDDEEESISIKFDELNAPDVPAVETMKYKRHICENCPYRTDNRTQYLYHKQFHRPNNAAPFKCNLCSYWATMQHLLTQHMKVHNEAEPDASPVSAPAPDNTKVTVKRSQSTESSQISVVLVQRGGVLTKMFKCRFCPMMNKKRANVRVHEKMHGEATGDGKYTCSLCNYKCLGQGSLTNHMKIHQTNDQTVQSVIPESVRNSSEELPLPRKKVFSYFCMQCPAVFKSSSDLYIHKTFHGSSLPFPCPHCDYRAKHKPHLHKHLQVHTLAYVAKRDASFGPPVDPDCDKSSEFLDDTELTENSMLKEKKVDQMLLLEVADLKMSMKKGKEFEKRLHKCTLCPSVFSKAAVLAYHVTLHGSAGEFGCSQCDYATTRSANLSIHAQVHAKRQSPSPAKRSGRVMQCPKCPAQFSKNDRFERHINLHGKNYRFVCNLCDYSVRFAANLSKHKLVHLNAESFEQSVISSSPQVDSSSLLDILQAVDHKSENSSATTAVQSASDKDKTNQSETTTPQAENQSTDDKKVLYLCDRCPYSQARKDAVQSHQNRHYQKEGYQCPHCDYRSMGSAFLREHIKSHVQQVSLYHPEAFVRYEKMEIYITHNGTRTLLFADKGVDKELHERFFPSVEEKDEVYFKGVSASDVNSPYRCKKRYEPPVKVESNRSLKSSDSNASITIKNPKVVLTDIFSKNKTKSSVNVNSKVAGTSKDNASTTKDTVKVADAKQSSMKMSTSKSEPSSSGNEKPPKSSIIVKIKVENSDDNSNTPHYTISSSNKDSQRAESCSDGASDCTLPVADLEDLSTENEKMQVDSPAAETICSEKSLDATENTMDVNDSPTEEVEKTPSKEEENLPSTTPTEKEPIVRKIVVCASDEPEVDFLKRLDTMVNGVSINSKLAASDSKMTEVTKT